MLSLSTEQEMLVSSLIDLSESKFSDNAFTWEKPPWPNVLQLAKYGYLGVNIAEEYGGGGMGEFEAMLTIEAVGQVCPDTAEFLYNQQMVAPRAIEMFGTEEAKERYLPPVTAGEDAICIAISESESGSDVGSMRTEVKEIGDKLVLNGEKTWVSHVEASGAALVWTRFPEGLGSVVIEFDWDGVDIEQHYTNMADQKQTQFRMSDVFVPEANVVTRGSEGFKQQLRALNWERLGSATVANAWSRCALTKALDYAKQRQQFGQPISDFQGIEWKLADMVKQLESSRALTYRAAAYAEEQGGIPNRLDASLAKLLASETVEYVTSESLQIFGANGYQKGHPLEDLYRRARGRRLAAGTDEIQKNQIADELKKNGVPGLI